MEKITKGEKGDKIRIVDYLAGQGIEISTEDIMGYNENKEELTIVIDGLIVIKKDFKTQDRSFFYMDKDDIEKKEEDE